MNKKGQAAIEFLVTYGWAFMVVVGIIGYLSYAFISNPSNVVPDSCEFTEGLICVDSQITTSGVVKLYVDSANGGNITITQMRCESDNSLRVINDSPNMVLSPRNPQILSCDLGNGGTNLFKINSKEKVKVMVTYIPDGKTLKKVVETDVVASVS